MDIQEIEPQARRNMLRVADAYLKATGRSAITVSRSAHSDPRFIDGLRAQEKIYRRHGKRLDSKQSCTLRVYDQWMKWFIANWPAETAFPHLDDLTHTSKGNHDGQAKRQSQQTERSRRSKKAPQEQSAHPQTASDRLRKLRGLV